MGDCLELLPELKGNSTDLIICDINYGTLNKTNPKTAVSNKTFSQKELKEFCKQIRRVLNNNGTLIFFAKELVTVDIINLMRRDYKYRYVWKKGNKTTNFLNASFQPLCNHEDILVFQKPSTPKKKHIYVYNPQMVTGKKRYASMTNIGKEKTSNTYGRHQESLKEDTNEHFPTTIVEFGMPPSEAIIPTQKPVDLMLWLINTYTNPGQTVLDPCMGVGSTGIACSLSGRNFIGYEIDEQRFHIAEKRIYSTPKVTKLDL